MRIVNTENKHPSSNQNKTTSQHRTLYFLMIEQYWYCMVNVFKNNIYQVARRVENPTLIGLNTP